MSDYAERIPQTTLGSLRRYVQSGIRGGDFLYAVLTNDLLGAFRYADQENLDAMHDIVRFVYNRVDARCHGSREAVERWMGHHGLDGINKED